MNKEKMLKVIEITEKVMTVNEKEGNNVGVSLNKDSLYLFDRNEGCESIINYEGITSFLYFSKEWEEYFEPVANLYLEKLEEYLR